MADEDDDIAGGEDYLTEGLEAKKTSGKKIVIIVAAVVVLGLIGWAAMAFFGSDEEAAQADNQSDIAEGETPEPVDADALPAYLKIENMVVNLNTRGRGIILLRISIALELESEADRAVIEQLMPAINNDFIVYLKSLRPDDLDGPKGLMRIKEELLVRINQSIAPKRIRNILFEDFLTTPQ